MFAFPVLAFALGLGAVFLAADCERKPAGPRLDQGPAVMIKNARGEEWRIEVELARTPEQRATGLMYRWSLGPDRGMLFIFDDAVVRTFWMKNTRIPLDMIFIGPDRTIVGIVENAEPYTETARSVPAASQWVLEVDGGAVQSHGVAPGDRVYFFNIEG